MCALVIMSVSAVRQDVLLDGLEKADIAVRPARCGACADGGICVVKQRICPPPCGKAAAQQLAQSFCGIGYTAGYP